MKFKLHILFVYQKNIFISYNLLINFIIIYYITNISNEENIFNSTNKIILTINGTGNQAILSNQSCSYFINGTSKKCIFNFIPDIILVNNISQNYKDKNVYNLTEEINIITIIWNYQITDCCCMFRELNNLTKIDLSYFNTSLVTDMTGMFDGCSSLISLNLNNFNTSLVTNMYSMFFECSSLISLNLNNFDTSFVSDMSGLFSGCSSLISLNLNNFNTSLVTNMYSMFSGCSSLISLNLNNFNTSLVTYMDYMFSGCSSLISLNLNNFNTSLVTSMDYMFYGCSSLISLNLNNFNTSLVTSMKDMFSGCNSNLIYCINEIKENNLTIILSNFRKDCNNTCFVNLEHKFIKEENKCINNCYDDNQYKFEYNNICYEICPEGTNTLSKDKYLCDDKSSENLENISNNEFTEESNCMELFNNECIIENNSTNTKDKIITNIKNEILNGNLDELIDKLLNDDKKYIIIDNNNIKYEIATTNQNHDEYLNISILKLGECENKLKNHYNIDEKQTLIIFKIDIYEGGLLIPVVEYEVYDLKNKKQLDLKYL